MKHWQDLKNNVPKTNTLYFITDKKHVALAKFSCPDYCWEFLWHNEVFKPTHMLQINLPPIKEETMINEKDVAHYPVDAKAEKEVHESFTYHPPFGDQAKRYEIIRDQAREFAFLLLRLLPSCADRTAAIRKLRECVMTANAAIAINEKDEIK